MGRHCPHRLTSRSVSLAERYQKDPPFPSSASKRGAARLVGWDRMGLGGDVSLMINNKDNIPAGRTTTFYCRRAFHFSGRQQQQPTILQIVRWSFPSLARLSSCHAPSSYSKFPFLHTHSGSSSRHHLGLACIGGVTRVA